MKWFVVILAIVLGNIIWQGLNCSDWTTAFERSYFQIVAVMCVFFMKPWIRHA